MTDTLTAPAAAPVETVTPIKPSDASSDPTMHDEPERPRTCQARTGYASTPYGEMTTHCGQRIGVVTFVDHTGLEHVTCRPHEAGMRVLWPETARVLA